MCVWLTLLEGFSFGATMLQLEDHVTRLCGPLTQFFSSLSNCCFISLLLICLIFSSPVPAVSPSNTHTNILGDLYFTMIAPPRPVPWPLLYAKQVSGRTRRTAAIPHKEGDRVSGAKTHSNMHTHWIPRVGPWLGLGTRGERSWSCLSVCH